MRKALFAALMAAAWSIAWGQGPVVKSRGQIEWKASGSLPPGAEYHLVYEDKNTHAVEILVRFPSGYALPPHSHTHDERILILKGKLSVELDGKATVLTNGSYATIPAGTVHALKTKGGCEMLVSLNGPFDVKGLPPVK